MLHWLVIIGLAVWAFVQENRIRQLERRLGEAKPAEGSVYKPPPLQFVPPPPSEPAAAPAPPAVEAPAAPKPAAPPPKPAETAPRPVAASVAAVRPAVVARPPAAQGAPVSTWLAENGLAWIGGGALMLGGLLLVVYAAQRGVFTPPFRIAAAILLGLLMIAASEWIRRRPDTPGARHALAASVTAGAGAATLYAAVWAAFALYHLIPFEVAASLVVATSMGLLALSLLHGQPLAILALLGALAAPATTGLARWNPLGLDGYLVVLGATGLVVVAVRRWGGAGLVALGGLALWASVALAQDRPIFAAVLVLGVVAGAGAAVDWRARRTPAPASPVTGPPQTDAFAALPAVALLGASLLSLGFWVGRPHHEIDTALVVTILLTALSGVLVWRRLVVPGLYAGPPAAAALSILATFADFSRPAPSMLDQTLLVALAAALAGVALLLGARRAEGRNTLIGIGAIGAALLVTLVWSWLERAGGALSWAPPAILCAAMALGSAYLARAVEDRATDRALALWLAGAAETLFLAIHAATPHAFAPLAHAAAATALAVIATRLTWRGLASTAVAGGLVTLASMLRPAFVLDVLHGPSPIGLLAAVIAGAALALAAAARLLGPKARTESEAQFTAALLVALLGAFYVLHRLIAAPAQGLGPLLEASLRTDLLLVAGLLLAMRAQDGAGPIARWRLIVIVAVGVAHGVLLQGLAVNPWWGLGEAPLGPPLINTLLLAFLAPAVLLGLTARRGFAGPAPGPRLAAVAAFVFALLWAVMETRHAFHLGAMKIGPVGRAEAGAYAIVLLLAAGALAELRRRRLARPDAALSATSAYLAAVAQPFAWFALALATWTFCYFASPWWGPSDVPLASFGDGALLFSLMAVGAGMTLVLSAVARRDGWTPLTRTALSAGVVDLFVLLTLLVRWAFRGADMRVAVTEASVETWTYSALWGVFGLAVLVIGGARRDITLRWLGLIALIGAAAKVLLFDMAALDGVIRAASFLAVGALLIVGALAARRLNADGAVFFRLRRAKTPD